MNTYSKRIPLAIGIVILTIGGIFIYRSADMEKSIINHSRPQEPSNENNNQPEKNYQPKSVFVAPMPDAKARITKKPFGIFVSPNNSPVSPEIYTGYHNGVDFEIFENEQDVDVEIKAVCSGPLLEKRVAEGYGGIAVQRCSFENKPITVIYGHLKFSSIKASINQELPQAETIGVLGKGFSAESGGERKHLYIGIYTDTDIDIRGYVQNKNELNDWINLEQYFEES